MDGELIWTEPDRKNCSLTLVLQILWSHLPPKFALMLILPLIQWEKMSLAKSNKPPSADVKQENQIAQ